jgi:hypothetical protein
MPVSRPFVLSWLAEQVIELKPKSILDVGIGFGLNGLLFRQYTDAWNGDYKNWKTKIDGVEISGDYILPHHYEIYDNVMIGDALTVDITNYDLIYAGDIFEHLKKEDGLKLLEKLRSKSRILIIVTPLKMLPQGTLYGNEYETHICQWRKEDFVGAETFVIGNALVIKYSNFQEVYYCEGMKFYGERAEKLWGYKKYSGNEYAPLLFIGLYFDEDYELFKNHKGVIDVFWNGSDVQRLLVNPLWIKILQEKPAVHTCHNKLLQSELRSVGIEAKINPIFFGDPKKYSKCYKPSLHPRVYMNAHPGREEEYGVPKVLLVSEKLLDYEFHVYGVSGKNMSNVFYHGWVDEEIMDREIKDMQCCVRLNKHDGESQIVMKAKLMGQPTIITTDEDILFKELLKLKEVK